MCDAVGIEFQDMHSGVRAGRNDERRVRCRDDLDFGESLPHGGEQSALPDGMQVGIHFIEQHESRPPRTSQILPHHEVGHPTDSTANAIGQL